MSPKFIALRAPSNIGKWDWSHTSKFKYCCKLSCISTSSITTKWISISTSSWLMSSEKCLCMKTVISVLELATKLTTFRCNCRPGWHSRTVTNTSYSLWPTFLTGRTQTFCGVCSTNARPVTQRTSPCSHTLLLKLIRRRIFLAREPLPTVFQEICGCQSTLSRLEW